MNKEKRSILGAVVIVGLIYSILLSLLVWHDYKKPSKVTSPVEEMYHKQLVVTLDSILDARFGAGYCKEDIDTDSVTVIKGRFNGFLAPME